MATYNGEGWLSEQLDSIRNQQQVDVRVVVSDDQSADCTLKVLDQYSALLPLTILPVQKDRFGSANRNFLRLIRDADIGEAAYVALADQDDIWHPDKLARAVARLRSDGADAYSSDVEAFWPDGRTAIIKKSYPLKRLDYVFGSPGPGCTFVFTRAIFLNMRDWVTVNFTALSRLWVHDWILYSYARARGFRWIIDNVPTMRYRQHHSNEIGVNFGLKAIQRRLDIVKRGRYRHDIVIISELTKACPECSRALRRLSWRDRLWLIRNAGDFRRSVPEVIALQIIFLLMPNSPISDAYIDLALKNGTYAA
jgi:rhamnosyltransferase